MKFKVLYSILGLAFAASLFMGNANGPAANGNGNVSGAVAGNTCGTCHGAVNPNATTNIQLEDSQGNFVTEYTPGAVYRVFIGLGLNGTSAPNTGFQATVRNSDNSNTAGTIALAPNSVGIRIINGLAEHSQKNTVNGTFSFQWTAPAAGAGSVQIFANGVLSNNNNLNSGDAVAPVASVTITEAGAIGVNETATLRVEPYLFPTRAESELNVRFTAAHDMEYTMEVVSVMGQLLSSQTVRVGSGEQTQTMNVAELAQGMYFLRLRTAHSVEAVLPFQK